MNILYVSVHNFGGCYAGHYFAFYCLQCVARTLSVYTIYCRLDFIFLPLSFNVPRLRDSSRVNGILLRYDSSNTHPGQTLHTLLGTHCQSVCVRLKTSPYNVLHDFVYYTRDTFIVHAHTHSLIDDIEFFSTCMITLFVYLIV